MLFSTAFIVLGMAMIAGAAFRYRVAPKFGGVGNFARKLFVYGAIIASIGVFYLEPLKDTQIRTFGEAHPFWLLIPLFVALVVFGERLLCFLILLLGKLRKQPPEK